MRRRPKASRCRRACSRGPHPAAPSPTAATRASPNCCSTPTTHRIVGGGIVGTHAGDLISELALAIEMGADAVDIGKTIHPHPTLSESVGLAAEAFEGVCTDLPTDAQKSMTQDEQKQLVAREAIKYVEAGAYVGVGSGSTANYFIDELAKIKGRIKGAVASSVRTADRLKSHGIPVVELQRSRSSARLHRRRRRSHRARCDDQGRRRCAYARKDRRLRRREIRVHRRRVQAGRRARRVPAAGRSDSDGAQHRRAGSRQAGWPAAAARKLHHRQRQSRARRRGYARYSIRPSSKGRSTISSASSPTACSRAAAPT